ncbi:uncharacterized protein LY79DRAFT_231163 [Colletotrichum navitas]|uniref:Uncharacterized protein n=1 Tax=Colletotrichum navitas TaxID=681940 RepID=A0AAD8PYE4_9PEZI|nr:uncharacterized protein LY79DRAFT_231163 [Colletotrichum navitas]KAK1589885.1 hypothetical protein LY79DRAFT_231163 [Colletotrichum navitas]
MYLFRILFYFTYHSTQSGNWRQEYVLFLPLIMPPRLSPPVTCLNPHKRKLVIRGRRPPGNIPFIKHWLRPSIVHAPVGRKGKGGRDRYRNDDLDSSHRVGGRRQQGRQGQGRLERQSLVARLGRDFPFPELEKGRMDGYTCRSLQLGVDGKMAIPRKN